MWIQPNGSPNTHDVNVKEIREVSSQRNSFLQVSPQVFANLQQGYIKLVTKLLQNVNMKAYAIYRVWSDVVSSDLEWPLTQVSRSRYFQRRIFQNGAFDIVPLLIIHLLNLQCNVPMTRGRSAIAASLAVFNNEAYNRVARF